MKEFIYSFYALLFNLFVKLLRIKKNRVALVSMHNENFNDSLGGIYEELKTRGDFDFVFISRKDLDIKSGNIFRVISFFLIKSRKLATAKYIFLNDNFLPMSKLNIKKEATVVQLWHGEGVFKKFGFSIAQENKVRQREIKANEKLTYVICSSKAVVPYYAKAFSVKEENVLALGSARTDYFFKPQNAVNARNRLNCMYPELAGKRLIIYAPTFRDNLEKNAEILSHFDFNLLERELSDEYAVLVRLHPQIHAKVKIPENVYDVTDFDDVRQLVLSCDILITDYSSICMDFALLEKKTIFYAYDLEEYISYRDFYFDYTSYVPGKTVCSTEEIIDEIKRPFDKERNDKFKRFNFDFADDQNAKRIVDFIFKD